MDQTTNANETMKIAYTDVDYFGAFGEIGDVVTQFICPTGSQVAAAVEKFVSGDELDSFDAAIVDMVLSGV